MAAGNDVFHAVAHPARREILKILRQGERPAGELAEPFGMSFSAISQHLTVLKEADLVSERREGRSRIYRLNPLPMNEIREWVADFQSEWNDRLDALERQLDEKASEEGIESHLL